MNFPLIPKAEAMALLEDAIHADEARGEFLAEQGSSYFYGGMQTPGDAEYMALCDLRQQEQDFLSSAEGEEWTAKMGAARLYDALPAVLSDDLVPEFVDGKVSYAHSLFPPASVRFSYSPDPDDIPF